MEEFLKVVGSAQISPGRQCLNWIHKDEICRVVAEQVSMSRDPEEGQSRGSCMGWSRKQEEDSGWRQDGKKGRPARAASLRGWKTRRQASLKNT